MHATIVIDVLAMLSVFVTILLLMICCTCWLRVVRSTNDLYYKPKIVDFRRRRRSLSPVPYIVYIVDVPPDVQKKKTQEDLKYLEYAIV